MTADARWIQRQQLASHVREFLKGGTTIQFLTGMDSERMNAAYGHARALYHNGNYADACEILKFLCLQNHLEKDYFVYLGASYQKLNKMGMAIKAYTHAAIIDADDPNPHYNMALCYLALNNLDAAGRSADDAHARALNDPLDESGKVRFQVESLQQTIVAWQHAQAS